MIRYLIYFIALYLVLPVSAVVDVLTIIVFFIIINEDMRIALIFSFFTGLLIDLYQPVRIGINTLIYIVLTQSLLFMKRYLVINPLTTIATFCVFYLIKIALANILASAPINLLHIGYTIAAFFPATMILNRIHFGIWMRA
jgi:cell shape-determining protein MreD